MKNPKQRVVITGMGLLAPNGNSLESFWQNTLQGVSGIAPITRFDTADFPVKIAGEIKNFDVRRYVHSSQVIKPKRLGIHTQFGIAATQMAVHHAGFSPETLREIEPVTCFLGVSTSAIEVIENGKEALLKHGPKKVSPYTVTACQPHAVIAEIVKTLGIKSRTSTYSSACPSGLEAIGNSMEYIRSQKGNLVICGGTDSPITPLTLASFHLTGMILSDSPDPATCSRPFDANRKGGVLSEGASMFVLESLSHALNRGAKPLAEIVGFGSYSDEIDAPSGSGLLDAMSCALDDAGLLPSDIDYINAHGPGHPVIDVTETRCIKELFGAEAYRIPVSSIKGVVGNPLAAAGGLQMAATVMALREKLLPPTANYSSPDPDCDLHYIPRNPLKASPQHALINLHGLGGGNISLIVKQVLE